MSKPVLNIDDLEFRPWEHGERFGAQLGDMGRRLGARKLGYNLTVVAPGKRAFPFHSHRVNEEMFFILDGAGEVRIGTDTWPVRAGDVVACPPGGPDTAHQLINTSDSNELRYLAVSTKESPEIAEYPDSGKYGILAEFPPGPDGKPDYFRCIVKDPVSGMDAYWEGE